MDAAMALFAERGFDGTSVGEIERTAGLAPRSGALYQHFKGGKDEVLRCALERELRAVDEFGSVMEMLPLGDLRAELTLMARWNLTSLERRSELARFVRRDAARLPAELRDKLYERLVGRPYEQLVTWLESRLARCRARGPARARARPGRVDVRVSLAAPDVRAHAGRRRRRALHRRLGRDGARRHRSLRDLTMRRAIALDRTRERTRATPDRTDSDHERKPGQHDGERTENGCAARTSSSRPRLRASPRRACCRPGSRQRTTRSRPSRYPPEAHPRPNCPRRCK